MKRVLVIIFLNLFIVTAEIVFGLIANSMALIADALHNLGDVFAVIITFIALYFGKKSASLQMTFGYHRAEMMAAFLNGLFLMVTMLYLIYETMYRLIDPPVVDGSYVILVAFIALIANAFSALLLQKEGHEHHHHHGSGEDHHHGDLNIHSAFLHMLSDALISFAVVAGGVIIFFYDTYIVDPILTLLFSVYILYATWPLVRKSFWSLMDSHSKDLEQIIEAVKGIDGVTGLSDIHLTVPSSKMSYFSAQLHLEKSMPMEKVEASLKEVKKLLLEEFGINHTVLEQSFSDVNALLCQGTHV